MKSDNTVFQSSEVSRAVSHRCCLARVNALLKSLRVKHDRAAVARESAGSLIHHVEDLDLHAPSLHDICAGELEASFASEEICGDRAVEFAIRYDSPREIARARLVFAATLVVPLVLVAATLSAFDGELGRASTSLLTFSALALTTPLILALAGSVLRSGWQGARAHPVIALAGVAAASGYAGSAFAMVEPGAGSSPALMLSMAGLLVMSVHLGHWLRVRRVSI
ncbi:hypothetical protein [Dokdonella sp.]|uniref:hypothetical protein n=1 Tax=Dokdonella sp. TaxID=2291710 RepID=UPI003C5BB583